MALTTIFSKELFLNSLFLSQQFSFMFKELEFQIPYWDLEHTSTLQYLQL